MIVRVCDIPHEGLSLNFNLEPESLSERLDGHSFDTQSELIESPRHSFLKPVPVDVFLSSDGRTVEMRGSAKGEFLTLCSRCAGEAKEFLDVPISVIVKPKKDALDEEDVGFALYEGEDLDCSKVVEDLLILNVPISSLCSQDCQGLCSQCGKNLNQELCECEGQKTSTLEDSNNPFLKLKQIKPVN